MSEYDTVADVPNADKWSLVTGSYERNTVLESIGEPKDKWSHGSLFVRIDGGEYTDVLFFGGSVPYLTKSVTRII